MHFSNNSLIKNVERCCRILKITNHGISRDMNKKFKKKLNKRIKRMQSGINNMIFLKLNVFQVTFKTL